MSIRLLQMEQMSGYLAARVAGVGAPGEVSELLESIAEHCKRTRNNKLLIDTTGFDLKISTLDRFLFGEKLQIFLRYRIIVAFFCSPEQVDPRKLGVLVAQNRGVKVDVFTDFQAAEEWLLKCKPSVSRG
jgi:hypothetical protein